MAGNYPTECPECGKETKYESCDGGLYSSCYGMCPNCGGGGFIVSCSNCKWLWNGQSLENAIAVDNFSSAPSKGTVSK